MDLERKLREWTEAAVIDAATAARIRTHEAEGAPARGMQWPVLIAVALGVLLLGIGVLLFIAAHWDGISPGARFALVLFLVAAFHLGAAASGDRWPALTTGLHAGGTIALGGGIFLAGQIFNLAEHWPGGLMLWALGALIGALLLRDWPQPALLALLLPAWLAGEWEVATEHMAGGEHLLTEALLVLALTYFTAETAAVATPLRRALKWVGGLALFPLLILVSESGHSYYYFYGMNPRVIPPALLAGGWVVGIGAPVALAYWLRGRGAIYNAAAAVWVIVFGLLPAPWASSSGETLAEFAVRAFGPFLWQMLGAVLLIAWGLRDGRRSRVNLGMAVFALAVGEFYFSNVMDKLGRSESLIGFGVLFIVGGWILERTRRRLVARITRRTA